MFLYLQKIQEFHPNFDPLANNMWLSRHRAQRRFQQAARKVALTSGPVQLPAGGADH